MSFFGHYTWGDPGLFWYFISFGGQSIEIRRYSLLELRIRSLLVAFHTVWRIVMLLNGSWQHCSGIPLLRFTIEILCNIYSYSVL